MKSITNSMFESIKTALVKNNNQNASFKNIMKFEPDNTYTVRLLPYVKDPTKTFFHYYTYDFNSYATGQYMSIVSPTTFGERCPITEMKYRIMRTGTDEEKEKVAAVRKTERWMVNAYVVKDPVNAENNNKVMIVRYGKQLHRIISDAIDGESSEDFGAKIFDLSSDGCNLKIKAEKQGEFTTYVGSRFSPPSSIGENSTEDKINGIYNSAFDLVSVAGVKSYDEINALLDTHYFCREGASTKTSNDAPVVKAVETGIVDIEVENPLLDDKVAQMLEGLDSID